MFCEKFLSGFAPVLHQKFILYGRHVLTAFVDLTPLHTSPSSICVATSFPVLAGMKSGVGGLSKNASVWHSVSTSIIRSLISSKYRSRNKSPTNAENGIIFILTLNYFWWLYSVNYILTVQCLLWSLKKIKKDTSTQNTDQFAAEAIWCHVLCNVRCTSWKCFLKGDFT